MVISIPLSKTGKKNAGKFETIIDDCDSDLLDFNWSITFGKYTQYASRKTTSKMIYMHRVILERKIERELLSSEFVDHRDGNGMNNCRDNLRVSTKAQNAMNTKSFGGRSPYKGVSWESQTRKWRAQIGIDGKSIKLGRFNTEQEAYEAYCAKAKEVQGEFFRE